MKRSACPSSLSNKKRFVCPASSSEAPRTALASTSQPARPARAAATVAVAKVRAAEKEDEPMAPVLNGPPRVALAPIEPGGISRAAKKPFKAPVKPGSAQAEMYGASEKVRSPPHP